jgi:hypothetical protein
MKFLCMKFPSDSAYLLALRPKYSTQYSVLKYPQSVIYPHGDACKTTGNIVTSYILRQCVRKRKLWPLQYKGQGFIYVICVT